MQPSKMTDEQRVKMDNLHDILTGLVEDDNNKGYKKPIFIKEEEMTYPKEIMEEWNEGKYCLQCTGCHGCR